jgi:hypothetical protein
VSYSHFDAGGRQQRVSERWHEFWAWAFWSADGSSAIAAGYLCLTVSFFLCLLMQDRPPEAEQDIPLLVLSSSGLTATVIFLLALVPICVP